MTSSRLDPMDGPLVQLPVWDSTHSPEILREGNKDHTERHESDENTEDDKDKGEDEDKDDSSAVPCDCSKLGIYCYCSNKMAANICRMCKYMGALKRLGASDKFPPKSTTTMH